MNTCVLAKTEINTFTHTWRWRRWRWFYYYYYYIALPPSRVHNIHMRIYEYNLDQVVCHLHTYRWYLCCCCCVEASMSPCITLNVRIDHIEYKQQKLRQTPANNITAVSTTATTRSCWLARWLADWLND